jgi:hypothetical protein
LPAISETKGWNSYQKAEKLAKLSQKRKHSIAITKAEEWAKLSQKGKPSDPHHSNEGQSGKKNTKMNMKTSQKLNVKKKNMNLDMNMRMHVKIADAVMR